LAYSSALKMEVTCDLQRTTGRYIPEDKTLRAVMVFRDSVP
jgi:hypothetical protein